MYIPIIIMYTPNENIIKSKKELSTREDAKAYLIDEITNWEEYNELVLPKEPNVLNYVERCFPNVSGDTKCYLIESYCVFREEISNTLNNIENWAENESNYYFRFSNGLQVMIIKMGT
jgi:hypothetical protein